MVLVVLGRNEIENSVFFYSLGFCLGTENFWSKIFSSRTSEWGFGYVVPYHIGVPLIPRNLVRRFFQGQTNSARLVCLWDEIFNRIGVYGRRMCPQINYLTVLFFRKLYCGYDPLARQLTRLFLIYS